MASLIDAVAAAPVIAILRAAGAERFADITDTLYDAGVRAVEFSLTTPGALPAISACVGRREGLAIGAGTVLRPSDVQDAVAAGAEYLVAPLMAKDTITEAMRLDVPILADAFSPTEIFTAWVSGSFMVKVFPATGGPAYIKAVGEPLPGIPLVPTGGVSLADAPEFMRAGAAALGMGGSLLGDVLDTGDLTALHTRAVDLVERLRPWAGGWWTS